MARQAKAELANLDPEFVAARVNEAERGLGYKWRALEVLQNRNPNNLSQECQARVVIELQKALADPATVFRIRESVTKALEIWNL